MDIITKHQTHLLPVSYFFTPLTISNSYNFQIDKEHEKYILKNKKILFLNR